MPSPPSDLKPGRRGPFRFLGGSVAGWVLMRIVFLALFAPALLAPLSTMGRRSAPAPVSTADAALHILVRRGGAIGHPVAEMRAEPAAVVMATPLGEAPLGEPDDWTAAGGSLLLAAYSPAGGARFRRVDEAGAERFAAAPSAAVASGKWSAQAYLFARGGRMRAIAPGGQLGASQAGVRVVRRVGDHVALAARVSTPTADTDGAEAAAGVDWLPFGVATPVRVSVERRVALGRDARDAWSAYVAGGFYRELDRALVVDGYAQAGIVGARRRDLFADGAIRAGRAVAVGDARRLTLGAGAWGAAQPHAERLDIGPRAAVSLPLGAQATGTLALEGRFRVAGAAQPGSGVAVTLATDF